MLHVLLFCDVWFKFHSGFCITFLSTSTEWIYAKCSKLSIIWQRMLSSFGVYAWRLFFSRMWPRAFGYKFTDCLMKPDPSIVYFEDEESRLFRIFSIYTRLHGVTPLWKYQVFIPWVNTRWAWWCNSIYCRVVLGRYPILILTVILLSWLRNDEDTEFYS